MHLLLSPSGDLSFFRHFWECTVLGGVYIFILFEKGNRWAFYISGNAFFLSLFFSEGMELISITKLQNIQLVSCLIENLKQVVHWTVFRRLRLSYFAF